MRDLLALTPTATAKRRATALLSSPAGGVVGAIGMNHIETDRVAVLVVNPVDGVTRPPFPPSLRRESRLRWVFVDREAVRGVPSTELFRVVMSMAESA